MNGNGTPDIGVLQSDATGTPWFYVKEGKNGNLLRKVRFDAAFTPQALAMVPDLNADGADEVAVLGIDASGKVRAQVKDVKSIPAVPLGVVDFDRSYTPKYFTVVPNADGAGTTGLAVLGINAAGDVRAQVKDLAGNPINVVHFSPAYTPKGFRAVANADGAGATGLALLGVDASGRVRVQMKHSDPAAATSLIRILYFDKAYSPLGFEVIPNMGGASGTPGLAVLGKNASGIIRAQVKDVDAVSPAPVAILTYTPSYAPQAFRYVADMDGAGTPGLAVLGVDGTTGSVRVQARDLASTLVRKVYFNKTYAPRGFAVTGNIPIVGGGGSLANEFAVLGEHATKGVRVQVKDGSTGDLVA
ncbi:MAG: hypothetical protein D6688_13020, partial [Alphaproteobacteria bacterium]